MDTKRRIIGLAFLLATAFPLVASADHEATDTEEQILTSYAVDEVSCSSDAAPCGCALECGGCGSAEPWSLPQPCFLQNMGVRMGGWIQQGVTFNPKNSKDGFNGPVATNDWDDGYQLNQVWFYLDRPVNTGGCGWDIGGHLDMTYGTDFRFGINDGLEDRINGFNFQHLGLVIPQAYLEVGYNDLSVKIGHYAAILDYEVVPAIFNPFYSHSLSYGFTVPQLVTGAIGDYKFTDQLSVQAGFHRGWSMFEDTNDTLDFIGGFKWKSCDERTAIRWAVSTGPQDPPADFNNVPGDQQRFVYSLVAEQNVTDKLKYVLVHNLGTEQRGTPTGDDAEWYGINQYLLYTINPCWAANMRFEWMRDDDGSRIAGPGNIPGVYAWDGRGFVGNFYELTMGLNWRPQKNILVRPEARWDWFDLDGPLGPTGLPYNGGDDSYQFTAAVDATLIY